MLLVIINYSLLLTIQLDITAHVSFCYVLFESSICNSVTKHAEEPIGNTPLTVLSKGIFSDAYECYV